MTTQTEISQYLPIDENGDIRLWISTLQSLSRAVSVEDLNNLLEDSLTNYEVVEPFAGVNIPPLRDIPISEMDRMSKKERK